ncbi:MAG: SURF1 family protein [Rhodobacteraceae bacterium]|nr:SURF1 family protein [Paracoccaceae bacterium]
MTGWRRLVFLGVVGLGGVAALIVLGTWQLQRLEWKTALLVELEDNAERDALFVEGDETAEAQNYRPAHADGSYAQNEPPVRFLTSMKPFGAGHRVIHAFDLRRGGRILVDRGYVRQGDPMPPPPQGLVGLKGTLHWPNEIGYFTPKPNQPERLWFARDVPTMAKELDAKPVMLVLGINEVRSPIAIPVEMGVPNNHLVYAITWYSLALVWFIMTVVLAVRRPDAASIQEDLVDSPAPSES